ncbi:MAG: hypothetical protein Fur0041_12110 [Bacteroidia bacterium]
MVVHQNKLYLLADELTNNRNRLCTITPTSPSTVVLVSPDPGELINDFAFRNSLVYITGPFYTLNGVQRLYTACFNLSNNSFIPWSPNLNLPQLSSRTKVNIEYYRDSLYLSVLYDLDQDSLYHKLYVSHYLVPALRTLKTYNSNAYGIYGFYNDGLLIGNARLVELERKAGHSYFPLGSEQCKIYSWCLKPPTTLAANPAGPTMVCPGESNVLYSVTPASFYDHYNWTTNTPEILINGSGSTVTVSFTQHFNGGTIYVAGVTSCNIANSSLRSITIAPKPLPDAFGGFDDSLNCIVNQIVLHGTSSTAGAIFSWNGPSGISNADTILAYLPGNYVLTVTGPNGCNNYDTTIVGTDYTPPPIIPFVNIPALTCRDTSVVLDASVIYPTDSLFWSGPGITNPDNPVSVSQSANYLLTIVSSRNGCDTTQTIYVNQNIQIPPAYSVFSDSVLTCRNDSIILDAGSPLNSILFQWKDNNGDTFSNPYYATTIGAYLLLATDTTNGCVNTGTPPVIITSDFTAPGIQAISDTLFLNCSVQSLFIQAVSVDTSVSFVWSDVQQNNYANPLLAVDTGIYYLTAELPRNGCITRDSVIVRFENILLLNVSNDTTICPGSGAVLSVSSVGGTAPFTATWNNNAGQGSPVTVYPQDSLEYIVLVQDALGCIGQDTTWVFVPDPVSDSVQSFQPCDSSVAGGQIQIFSTGGVPPYSYSNDNGMTWQSIGVFPNLTYGSYSFLVKDSLGCIHALNADISSNSAQADPDFIVATNPEATDSLVFVDISNPRPDSVSWDFPAFVSIIDTSMFSPIVMFPDTGWYLVTMHAFYPGCELNVTKNITVQPFDADNAELWNTNGIDSLVIFPNPNNGIFTVLIELESRQELAVFLYDASGTEQIRFTPGNVLQWQGQLSIPSPQSGNYLLRVVTPFDVEEEVIIVTE